MSDNFDRLLVRAERRDRPARGTCPDAAVLAAYLDGTLASTDRATLEAHAADCSRCALQLATIVRLEDEARESRPAPVPARWRRFLWTVPVATAALAAIIYVAGTSRPLAPAPARDAGSASPAPAPMARPEAPPSEEAGSSPQVLADKGHDEARAHASSEKVRTTPAARLRRAAGNSLRKEAFAVPQPQPGASTDQPAAPPAASSPAVPEESETAARSDAAETDARAKTADTVAPASPPAAARGVAAREGSPLVAVGERVAQAAALVVHAPDSRVRWRVRNTRIERSVDGGLTWSGESSPIAVDLTMGAAPTAGVCWLASPSGQVLRRAETGAWTDVSPAPRITIAELTAVNEASAEIVSPDGTLLRTIDAGRTWIREERR